MRNFKGLLIAAPLAFAGLLVLGAGAASADTGSVTTSLTVLPPVAITVTQNLAFGSLTSSATAANVTVAPPTTAVSDSVPPSLGSDAGDDDSDARRVDWV